MIAKLLSLLCLWHCVRSTTILNAATGWNVNTNSVITTDGTPEPRWFLSSTPNSSPLLVHTSGYPISTGEWQPNDAFCAWITPGNGASQPPGYWIYQLNFVVPDGINVTSIIFSGLWYYDNAISFAVNGLFAILINDDVYCKQTSNNFVVGPSNCPNSFRSGSNNIKISVYNSPSRNTNPTGFRLRGDITGCPTQCLTCDGANTCTQCKPGFTGPDCTPCPASCQSYGPSCSCTSCSPGLYLSGTTCYDCNTPSCSTFATSCSCSTCVGGFFNSNGICKTCTIPNCVGFGSSGCTCTQCISGFTAADGICVDVNECATRNGGCHADALCTNNVDASPTCVCNTGFTGNGQNCTACPAPCATYAASCECDSCLTNSFLSSRQCVVCTTCANDQVVTSPCTAHADTVCGRYHIHPRRHHNTTPATPATPATPSLTESQKPQESQFNWTIIVIVAIICGTALIATVAGCCIYKRRKAKIVKGKAAKHRSSAVPVSTGETTGEEGEGFVVEGESTDTTDDM